MESEADQIKNVLLLIIISCTRMNNSELRSVYNFS